MDESKDTYYGLRTDERLRHHGVDDFVESYLEEREARHWPDTIEVVKWERQKLGDGDFQVPDDLYEALDEEYGDPDGDRSIPSENVRAVKDEYFVWACEPTDVVYKVDVKKWVQEKRPDWLTEDDVRERFPA